MIYLQIVTAVICVVNVMRMSEAILITQLPNLILIAQLKRYYIILQAEATEFQNIYVLIICY